MARLQHFYITPEWREIPNDPGLVSSMEAAINRTALAASRLANEEYRTSTVRGVFRTYVEARGEEPPSRGYYRGKWKRALWSNRPYLTDTGSR